jgi:hypothetical protein
MMAHPKINFRILACKSNILHAREEIYTQAHISHRIHWFMPTYGSPIPITAHTTSIFYIPTQKVRREINVHGKIHFPCPDIPAKYACNGISPPLYRGMISRGIDSIRKSHFRSRRWLCLRLVPNTGRAVAPQKRGYGRPAEVSVKKKRCALSGP